MSHNKSPRQLANLFKNRRSVWIEIEDGQLVVYVKHGIRVEARRAAATKEEVLSQECVARKVFLTAWPMVLEDVEQHHHYRHQNCD